MMWPFPSPNPAGQGRARGVLLALLLGLAWPVWAQGNIIDVPLGNAEPGADGAAEVLTSERFARDRIRGTEVQGETDARALVSPLRPLQARGRPTGSAIRFDGERRDLLFALHVPDPSVVRSLRVSTLSSINLLPERSQFRAYLNDTFIGSGPLDNFTDFSALDLPLTAGVLQSGHNEVRLELVQYHRIFCGPDASFALWTDVDLSNSGAVLDVAWDPRDAASSADGFIMGVSLAAASGAGIEIRGAAGLGEHRDAWLRQITGQMQAALGGEPLPFRFTEYWSVAGEAGSAARITLLPGTQNRASFRAAGDGTQVMVVEYVPGSRPSPMPELEVAFPPIALLSQPNLLDTTRPAALSEVGFTSREVRDRYTLIEQVFRLPDDYVVLTNAKAELRLDYIYAEGLPVGSMMLVHINGQNIRLLPLRGEGGTLIQQFPVRFEARHLRAGTNTLAFEVMVPGDPPDLPCPLWSAPILAIGETSTLSVPFSPSLFLPDMHFAFSSLTGRSVQLNDMTLRAFSDNDVLTLRAALAQGMRTDRGDIGARLFPLALDDLGSIPVGDYSISRRLIEDVLIPPMAEQIEIAESGPAGLLRATNNGATTSALSGGWNWAVDLTARAVQWMHPQAGTSLEEWLSTRRGEAVLLQLDPSRPDSIWLLRSPGSDMSQIASAMVAARTTGEGPRGQVSVLDVDGRWHNWFAPDRQPVLLEPVTLSNMRHVLGNFVSAMPIRFVMGLFFLALLSAVFALRLVISTREHEE